MFTYLSGKIMKFWSTIYNWSYFWITIIAIIIICSLIVIITYRRNIYKLMAEAENGNFIANQSEHLKNVVQAFQDSDVDDRMIYVIAGLLDRIPFVHIFIPQNILIKILNYFAQGTFDAVKNLLDATAKSHRNPNAHVQNKKVILTETDLNQLINNLTNVVQKEVDKRYHESVKPSMFMTELKHNFGNDENNKAYVKVTPKSSMAATDSYVDDAGVNIDSYIQDALKESGVENLADLDVTEDDVERILKKVMKGDVDVLY